MARDWGPDIRFPPPILYIAGFLLGMWIEASVSPLTLFGRSGPPLWAQIAGMVTLVLGLSITLWGFMTFRLAMTPIVTFKPATTLVTHGPYRFSRNPMYIGLTLAYIGLAIAIDVAWALLLLPIVLVALVRFVVRKEERHMNEKFGAAYEAYRKRVGRWF